MPALARGDARGHDLEAAAEAALTMSGYLMLRLAADPWSVPAIWTLAMHGTRLEELRAAVEVTREQLALAVQFGRELERSARGWTTRPACPPRPSLRLVRD